MGRKGGTFVNTKILLGNTRARSWHKEKLGNGGVEGQRSARVELKVPSVIRKANTERVFSWDNVSRGGDNIVPCP